jgi:hypothetical protein
MQHRLIKDTPRMKTAPVPSDYSAGALYMGATVVWAPRKRRLTERGG